MKIFKSALLFSLLTICLLLIHCSLPVKANTQTSDISAYNEFETFTDLQNANLSEGEIVKTNGFATVGDGGSAFYKITKKSTRNNIFSIPIDNKDMYAELIISETINVAQVGILPDTIVSTSLNNLIKASDKSDVIKTIEFNDGNYILAESIVLRSFNYKGTGKTVLSVDKSFFSNMTNCILYCDPDDTHPFYTLSFSDIDFYMEICENHPMMTKPEVEFLRLTEVDGCKITNCHFKACPSAENGAFMATNLLWFNKGSVKNVEVSNCSFKNLTGLGYNGAVTDNLVGGCLWIKGNSESLGVESGNIKIHDCKFETTVNDEIIAVWRGRYDDIEISKCTFKNHTHDSNNLMSFFEGQFTNTVVKDCDVTIEAGVRNCFKANRIADKSDILYDHITINCISGITDTTDVKDEDGKVIKSTRNNSLFITEKESEKAEGIVPANIKITNCNVISDNGTRYRTFVYSVSNSQKTYEISNCNIDIPLDTGLFHINGTADNNIVLDSNTINTYSKIGVINSADACNVVIKNNTISNDPKCILRTPANITYTFEDNICTVDCNSAILADAGLTNDDRIILSSSANQYTEGSTVKNFSIDKSRDLSKIIRTAIPTAKEGLVFNGNVQRGINYDNSIAALYTYTGSVEGTDAGNYSATFTLKDGYIWSDGSTSAKTINWTIEAKPINENDNDEITHTPAEPVKENEIKATCESDGSYDEVIYCIECGDEISRNNVKVKAAGHDWGEWINVKRPTETEDGLDERVCKHDSSHRETRIVNKLESKPVVNPENIPAESTETPDTSTEPTYTVTSTDNTSTLTYNTTDNTNVSNVTVPDEVTINNKKYIVTEIKPNAFKNNKKLKKITIGKHIKKIGKNAFSGCVNLKNVTIKTTKLTKKTVGKNAFKNINKKAVIKVPKNKFKEYKKILKKVGIKGEKQTIKRGTK